MSKCFQLVLVNYKTSVYIYKIWHESTKGIKNIVLDKYFIIIKGIEFSRGQYSTNAWCMYDRCIQSESMKHQVFYFSHTKGGYIVHCAYYKVSNVTCYRRKWKLVKRLDDFWELLDLFRK